MQPAAAARCDLDHSFDIIDLFCRKACEPRIYLEYVLERIYKLMRYKFFILFFCLHAGLGFCGLLLLEGSALAAADAGTGAAGIPLTLLALAVRYVLLQPVAHWLLPLGGAGVGTWTGLAQIAAIVLINSLIVAGLATVVWRRLHRGAIAG